MNKRIQKFITENKVLTMCTSKENVPYCASCCYAYDEENQLLIFSSENHTRHIEEAIKNSQVAGTINTESKTVAKIQGIQFKGEFIIPNEEQQSNYYQIYYKKFPFAKAMKAPIWAIELTWIKMTDNTLGFGKKLEWESEYNE